MDAQCIFVLRPPSLSGGSGGERNCYRGMVRLSQCGEQLRAQVNPPPQGAGPHMLWAVGAGGRLCPFERQGDGYALARAMDVRGVVLCAGGEPVALGMGRLSRREAEQALLQLRSSPRQCGEEPRPTESPVKLQEQSRPPAPKAPPGPETALTERQALCPLTDKNAAVAAGRQPIPAREDAPGAYTRPAPPRSEALVEILSRANALFHPPAERNCREYAEEEEPFMPRPFSPQLPSGQPSHDQPSHGQYCVPERARSQTSANRQPAPSGSLTAPSGNTAATPANPDPVPPARLTTAQRPADCRNSCKSRSVRGRNRRW